MNQQEHHFFEFGPFRLDATEGVLSRHGDPVHLTPKALKLLLVLVHHNNHIVDKDELMQQVWPDIVVEEANLAGNIHALRQVLGGGDGEERYIETISKRGYRFVAKVRQVRGDGLDLVTQERVRDVNGADEKRSEDSKTPVAASAGRLRDRKALVLKSLLILVVLGVLIGAASYFWGWGKAKPAEPNFQITSIAVLPFKNLSGDASQEYFTDGMTEAMINELAKIGALRVISRQSMMQYKNARKTTPEIARELNVDAVVDGSVLRSGDRVRITAQLIRAATDQHLWSENYERNLPDMLTMQSEIARGIAGQIRIKLTPQDQERLAHTQPIKPEAHEAYLKGRYYLNQAIDTPQPDASDRLHKKSTEYFEQAIKLDPGYTIAYSGLALSYHWLASSGYPEFYPKAKEAALKALSLDDTLAEAQGALAFTIWRHDWDFARAEREFQKAEGLAPNSSNMHGYAQFLSTIGRHDEAIRRIRLAEDRDPLTLFVKLNVGWIYLDARQYDSAIAQFRAVLELDSNLSGALFGLCSAHVFKGMYAEGIAQCQKALKLSPEMPGRLTLAWAYAMAGRRSEAIQILNEVKGASQNSIPHLRVAKVYGALGEKDQAMLHLEMAHAEHREGLLWLKVDPEFDGLRSDPRFDNLLRRIGFPA